MHAATETRAELTITARLSLEEICQVFGDMLVCVFAADDGGSQDRVRRGKARGNNKRAEKSEVGDQSVDKGSADEPAIGHDRNKEVKKRAPVLEHVLLWKLDTNGKHTNGQDNAGNLEGDFIDDFMRACPATGVENTGDVGPNDDTKDCCNDGFANVGLKASEQK